MQPPELPPRQTWIMHPFGTGVYKFALGIPQCLELEKGGDGIGKIASDVMIGRIAVGTKADANPFSPEATGSIGNPFHAAIGVPMLRAVLTQGLIGGNYGIEDGQEVKVSPRRAKELVDLYGPPARPIEEAWDVAAALMYAVMVGVEPKPEQPASENSEAGDAEG